jgi:glycine cleavage system regulatory protein
MEIEAQVPVTVSLAHLEKGLYQVGEELNLEITVS